MKLFIEGSFLARFQTIFAGEIMECESAQNGRVFNLKDPMLFGRFPVGTSFHKKDTYIEVGRFPEDHQKTYQSCQWGDPMLDHYPVGTVAALTERGFNIFFPRIKQ